MIRRMALLIIAILLVGNIIGMVTADPVKVMPVVTDNGESALKDADSKPHINKLSNILKSELKDKKVEVSVKATPRDSGGITLELFCRDNMGYYVPVWGGSITKEISDWSFTLKDIRKDNIDGCYFAVVDSTAEMEAFV